MAKRGITTKMVLVGVDEMLKLLETLPKKVVKKALKQAVNAGANPIMRKARQLAPVQSGLLKKAINKKVKSYPNGVSIAIVGADKSVAGHYGGGKNSRRIPWMYWHLVLGGTQPHAIGSGSYLERERRSKATKQSGRIHPGVRANNILYRAVSETSGQVKKIMADKLADVIAKESAKLAFKK